MSDFIEALRSYQQADEDGVMVLVSRQACDEALAHIAELTAKLAAAEAERDRLRAALLHCARQADALKKPCGMDPESPQAIRNGQYASISATAHIALGTIKGPQVTLEDGE